ncbi:MAG TPA: hypothetical protein VE422_30850 [Terriglobia bacterium]|nr:hypothetical protein [Terriglobia bacterium]
MTNDRWIREITKMAEGFPHFQPFWTGNTAGFIGELSGTNGLYVVTILADVNGYPAKAANVIILPIVGGDWQVEWSVCIPDKLDSCAELVLLTADCIKQFG